MAREALGWKPSGPKGGKLSPKHVAALHTGRDKHHAAKRKKKFSNTGGLNMGDILTAKEVGVMLKLSTRQVYELAKDIVNPLPSLRIRRLCASAALT
jgi:hypothetical protein